MARKHVLTKAEASNGGKVGGLRRAAKLTPKRRKEIARNAIKARWDRVRSAEK